MKHKLSKAWLRNLFAVSRLARISLRRKMLLVVGLLAFVSVAIAILGLQGLRNANDSLGDAYNQRIVPLKELKIVGDHYGAIIDTAHKVRNGNMTWPVATERLELAADAIVKHWTAYRLQANSTQEAQLVNRIEMQFVIANAEMQNLKQIFCSPG